MCVYWDGGGSLEAILHIRNRTGSPVQDILNLSAPHEGHRCGEEGSKRHTETKGEKKRWIHGKKGKEREHREKEIHTVRHKDNGALEEKEMRTHGGRTVET